MELKEFSDRQLAKRLIDYIERAKALKDRIADYSPQSEKAVNEENFIRREYEELKNSIREDARYVELNRNPINKFYSEIFSKNIKNASVYGFVVPINAKKYQKMNDAVWEAVSRLSQKIVEWKDIALSEE